MRRSFIVILTELVSPDETANMKRIKDTLQRNADLICEQCDLETPQLGLAGSSFLECRCVFICSFRLKNIKVKFSC